MLTAAQREMRLSGIGSSEIAAVARLNPWRTPLDVFYEKPTPSRPPLPSESTQDERTEVGDELEEAVARLYAKRHDVKIRRAQTLRHREHPWILATADRLIVGAHEGLEVKLVGLRVAHHWEGGLPDYVRAQVAWQMAVLDYDQWHVAALVGTDLRVFHVERDIELEASLIEAGREFWFERVLADVPPECEDEEERRDYLKRRYTNPTEDVISSTPEIDFLAARAIESDRIAKEAAALKDAAYNDLFESFGEHRGVKGEWGSASGPLVAGKVDWQAIAYELGGGVVTEALIKKHRGPMARRFCFYPKKA